MGAVWRGDGPIVWRGRVAGTDVRDFRGLGAEVPVHPPDLPPHKRSALGRGTSRRLVEGAAPGSPDGPEFRMGPLEPFPI